jgi:hypothetical protein
MKKYKFLSLALSMIGIAVGILLVCQPDVLFICRGYFSELAFPVWGISFSVFVISVILLFVRDEIFKSWLIFSAWFLPLSVALIILSPEYSYDIITPFDKKLTTMWMSSIFAIISLILIIYKSIKLRGK